jgi:tetratricopeptide (TPR) repeat protein
MASLFDFSRHIADLKKEKRYSDVLSYFKENKTSFSKEQLSNNEYVVSDIISCLRYTNQFDAGFQFLKIYDIKIDDNQKERILSAYGWLLWSKYKAENDNAISSVGETHFFDEDEDDFQQQNFHYDKNELIESIETLIPILLGLNSDFSKTLVSKLFSIVLKSEKKKPAPNWKLVNDFCNQINPTLLSTDCSTIQVERKGRTQDMELASDFENWYAYKTKALMKLGEWQECFDTSKEALEKIDNFHYSNDVWFSRRVALSKKNLGNAEDTIEELETILKKKREWFIQKELAELYFEKDDLDAAFKMTIDAINNFGPLEFKVDLLYLIGKILTKQGEPDLAFKHFSLSKLVRQDEEWKVPQKVFVELNQFEQSEIPLSELKNLKSELKKYWNSFSKSDNRQKTPKHRNNSDNLHGEIIKLLHDNERGKDGFIKSDDNEFYFSASPNWHLTTELTVGTKVIFKIIPAKDEKKEQTRILKLID